MPYPILILLESKSVVKHSKTLLMVKAMKATHFALECIIIFIEIKRVVKYNKKTTTILLNKSMYVYIYFATKGLFLWKK